MSFCEDFGTERCDSRVGWNSGLEDGIRKNGVWGRGWRGLQPASPPPTLIAERHRLPTQLNSNPSHQEKKKNGQATITAPVESSTATTVSIDGKPTTSLRDGNLQHPSPERRQQLDHSLVFSIAADGSRRTPASINPIDHRGTRSTGPVRPISNTLPLPLPCSPTQRGTGTKRERRETHTKTQSPGNPVRASPFPSDVPSFATEPFVHAHVCRVPNCSPYRSGVPLA